MLDTSSAVEYVRCNLSQKHLEGLRKRGLTDETIQRLGYYTERDPNKNGANLGWSYPARTLGDCLVIPYLDPEGNPAKKQSKEDWIFLPDPYLRLRPDSPRPREDDPDKTVKYESPVGVLNHAYFPINTRKAVLEDASIPVILTEGEFKAAKADQEGFPCIGLVGVDGAHIGRPKKKLPDGREKSYGPRRLIPDLKKVIWKGRTVYLIFDSDITSKPEVQWALWRLSESLRKQGAIVRMILLPEGPNGAKVGLDDYLVAHNSDALRRLIDGAKPPTRPLVKPGKAGKNASGIDLVMQIVDRHELLYSPSDRNERYISKDRLTMELVPDSLFEDFIGYEYFTRSGGFIAKDVFNAALGQLRNHCIFRGDEKEIFVRMGETPSAVYLSLNDKERHVVEIDRDGWRLCDNPPIRFRSSPTMMALPVPRHGGKITDLKPFLNLHDEEDFALVVGFLIGCFNVRGPFPALIAGGEEGSGKTTACRVLKKLIDNTKALSRAEAGEEKDMVIAAKNSWLMVFDNISHLNGNSSDAYARLATGAGLSARQKYTDDGEWVTEVKRPFILNGIEDFVRRGDLRSRCIFINFPNINSRKRLTEKEFWARFDQAHPLILGGLLDLVSMGIREFPHLPSDLNLPRMADFCKFVHACEVGSGKTPVFIETFRMMQIVQTCSELEESVLAPAIGKLIGQHKSGWTGTPGELLKALAPLSSESKTNRWPKSVNSFSGMLRRLAPALRNVIETDVQFFRETSQQRRRLISITSPGLFNNRSSGSSGAPSSDESKRTSEETISPKPCGRSSPEMGQTRDDLPHGSREIVSSEPQAPQEDSVAPDDPDDPSPKSLPETISEPVGDGGNSDVLRSLFKDYRNQSPPD